MDVMSTLSSIFFLVMIFLFFQEAALVIAIILGVILFAYNFIWSIPKSLMEFILENGLSEHLEYFYDAKIPIVVITTLLIFVWSIPVLASDYFKTKISKTLAVIFIIIPFVALLTLIHSETKDEYFKNIFNEKYKELAGANMYFESSKVGKELKNAIDTNNYTVINSYYPSGSNDEDYINKKVKGLSLEELIDKQALIKGVDLEIITSKFKEIADDRYITLEEYEKFKNDVLILTKSNDYKLTPEQLIFLYRI